MDGIQLESCVLERVPKILCFIQPFLSILFSYCPSVIKQNTISLFASQ